MKNTYSKIVLTACLLTLSSCTVGPDYQKPLVDDLTPKKWSRETHENPDAAKIGENWWEVYSDPTLNQLETDAIENNQNLAAAVARVDQARAASRQARSADSPEITTGASFSKSKMIMMNMSIKMTSYTVPLDLSYEPDLWGKIRRSIESAGARVEVSQAEGQQILLTLCGDVAYNYFQLRAMDSQAAILRKTVDLRKEIIDTLQHQFDAGTIPEIDLSRAKTNLSTAKADLAIVERSRSEFQNAIALLCGKAASDFKLDENPLASLPPEIPAGLPSELLERRPDIILAERTLVSKNAEIGVAMTGYFPSVRLSTGTGLMSTEDDKLLNADSNIWSFTPSISLPIFNGGRTDSQVEQAKAAYEESVANYKQSVLSAFKDVEDALSQVYYFRQEHEAYIDAAKEAQRATELAKMRYNGGTIGNLELIDAQRTQLQVELMEKSAQRQRLAASVRLIKSLGGGWDK